MNSLVLAVSALALSGCFGSTVDRVEEFSYTEPVLRVDARTRTGDIEIHEDAGVSETGVEAHVYGEATEVVARLDAGTLNLSHDCPERFRQCGVEWVVRIPASGGDERIFDAYSGSGDVDLHDTRGLIVARTGSGDIGLHDVVATQVDLETGSGDIGARISGEVESVLAETGSGDIGLRVPGGGYQLQVWTGSGDVDTRGVSNDESAQRSIDLRTGSGDVDLRGG